MKTDFIPMGFQYYRAPTPARSEWRKDLENLKKWGYCEPHGCNSPTH